MRLNSKMILNVKWLNAMLVLIHLYSQEIMFTNAVAIIIH